MIKPNLNFLLLFLLAFFTISTSFSQSKSEKLYNERIILDHGMKVGTGLANVLSGGDTTSDKLLTEDNLYQLELTSFMNLIETDQTKDRIRHTLATGKPLVN